jgi:hypothetical protein
MTPARTAAIGARRRAMYHEAGHAVIHWLAGFQLGPIGLLDDAGRGRNLARRTSAYRPRIPELAATKIDATIVGCLAGFEAENILRGRPIDFTSETDLAELYTCKADFDEAKRLIEATPGATWATHAPAYAQTANATLRAYWPAVVALADEILDVSRQQLVLTGPSAAATIVRALG